jgi:hypothetical protein
VDGALGAREQVRGADALPLAMAEREEAEREREQSEQRESEGAAVQGSFERR